MVSVTMPVVILGFSVVKAILVVDSCIFAPASKVVISAGSGEYVR